MTKPTLCVHHHPCADGFTAAWAVWKPFGDSVKFHPGVHGQPPPDVTGEHVVIVDFSYPRPVLFEMAQKAASITLLDHHGTAVKEIGNVPKSVAVPLANGATAYVDEDDFHLVSGYAWTECGNGGAVAYLGGGRGNAIREYMHTLIMPPKEGFLVDHRNRNSLDNRRLNLRYAIKAQNGANMDRGSKFKGIRKHRNKWAAQIAANGANKHLGLFSSEEEAALAYDVAAREEWGESARCNFGNVDPFPPNCHFMFGMEQSGAMMAWNYFHRHPAPTLVRHVQDRDLWKFRLIGTREIQSWVFSHQYDFAVWDELAETLERDDGWRSAFDQGKALDRKMQKDIAELIEQTKRTMVIGGHRVPVVNLPYIMASEAAGKLAENALFAAAYFDHADGHRVFSLRSRDGFDVGALAKQVGAALGFSGGGHTAAAGFRAPLGWEGES